MSRAEIRNDYFEWMFKLVCDNRFANPNLYRGLLLYLHSIEFTYCIQGDSDRERDGVDLRHRFALTTECYAHTRRCLDGSCSVLEMIIALAIRCEESLMTDPQYGDRTAQWFWHMIANLGLGSMTNSRINEDYVDDVIYKFLNREYEPDGHGGLFVIRNCNRDLREIDIWTQMMWYLDTMI